MVKIDLDKEHYGEINLDQMTFTIKRFRQNKIISHENLRPDMTLEKLKDLIRVQKRFLGT